MNFIFFIYLPLVHSVSHTFMTTYTGINGQTVGRTPEFFAVTTLDGQQIDYYDSDTQMLVPRQEWMKEFSSTDMWKEDTEIRLYVQQIYKSNIAVSMQRFNQTRGVHMYQRMYGCGWNDETEDSYGFDQYSYDGQDFISLDLKELRYITPVQQGFFTMVKWNNDKAQLDYLQQYYEHECIYWLKNFLMLMKEHLQRRAPEVSLLQKDPSSPVVCHATGFYPSAVTITWLRNEEEHHENVQFGDLLPNEDGTFQKTVILHVTPDDWKDHQFVCVVKHDEKTIRKILTEDEIKSNYNVNKQDEGPTVILILATVAGVIILAVLPIGFYIMRKKNEQGFKPVSFSDSDDKINYNKGS